MLPADDFKASLQPGLHAEHPKVQAMLDRGVDYLSKASSKSNNDYDGGRQALIAYTLLKVTGDKELPRVKEGIAIARQMVGGLRSGRLGETVVYSISVAAVLLAEADRLPTAVNWTSSWAFSSPRRSRTVVLATLKNPRVTRRKFNTRCLPLDALQSRL